MKYNLREFVKSSDEPCTHARLIPGLDASICSVCGLTYERRQGRRKAPNRQPLGAAADSPIISGVPDVVEVAPKVVSATSGNERFEVGEITLTKAVTLHRPWPYAIHTLGKNVENRTRNLRCVSPGEYIAIHSGSAYSYEGEVFLRELFPNRNIPSRPHHPTGVVAIAEFLGNVEEFNSPWFTGPVGWHLGKVFACENAVACSGKRGIWTLPPPVKADVLSNLRMPS